MPPEMSLLSPWGQVILLVFVVCLTFLTWRNKQWRDTARAAQTAVDIAVTECDTWKERGERLGRENRELLQELASLKARTDLQPLVDTVHNWVVEGRGRFEQAMQRLEVIHNENSQLAVKNIQAIEQATVTLTQLSDRILSLSKDENA